MSRLYFFIAIILITATGCGNRQEVRRCSGSIWATDYNITYTSDTDLSDSILATFKTVEQSLSPFDPESLISKINRGESTQTDTLLRRIFLASQAVNHWSNGAFDPTVAPLVNLWGFGYNNSSEPPTQEMIDSALMLTGINRCRLEGTELIKCSPETEFNFSAITKGYGCDLIGEMFRRNGVDDYMIEVGGEIALHGKNPKGEAWHIQIDAPIANNGQPTHQALTIIEVTDCGIATSGNYRNYHETKAGRTWHTIDPATGHPAETKTLSATVIADECMTADALATACMAMPSEKAMKMIESIPGASALLVEATADSTFKVLTTSRFPLH